MTESTFTSPRLERPAHAPLAGVSLALARTTGTDVVLWRVLFVVLTLFGGLGIAVYLVAYVAIPKEGEGLSLAERLVRGPDRRVSTRQLLLLAVVLLAVGGALHDNGGVVVVAALGAGYLLWRRRHPEIPPGAPVVEPVAPTWQAQPWQAPPPRQQSVLTALTLSSASLLVGVLLLVGAAGATSVPTEVVLAGALGTVGLGLVASAWWGRARGLVPVALLLALGLGATVVARPAIDHGVGDRTWVAQSAGSYRLGIGDATLTLGDQLGAGSGVEEVTARVSVGHLLVVVPEGIRVVVDARVQTGDVQAPGVDDSGRTVHRTFAFGPEGAPQVHVDARVGTGMVEVRRG